MRQNDTSVYAYTLGWGGSIDRRSVLLARNGKRGHVDDGYRTSEISAVGYASRTAKGFPSLLSRAPSLLRLPPLSLSLSSYPLIGRALNDASCLRDLCKIMPVNRRRPPRWIPQRIIRDLRKRHVIYFEVPEARLHSARDGLRDGRRIKVHN